MTNHLQSTVALLARTPACLDALVRGLPPTWVLEHEGEGTWSVLEVIAHLTYAEQAAWMSRIRVMLETAGPRTFAPFDRLGHTREAIGRSPGELLDEFTRLRRESLAELVAFDLREDDLAKTADHPAFGTVTLSQLLAAWAAHDLTHIHQITRIMASQYRTLVGPWEQYLGVMKCGRGSAA